MIPDFIPGTIPNWIDGVQVDALSGEFFDKLSPHSGKKLYRISRSCTDDIERAVQAAAAAQPDWSRLTPVQRGEILHDIAQLMRRYQKDIAAVVALETGMSFFAAMGETAAAIAQGEFMAGEGRRLYGRTTTSAVPHKYASTVRQPVGIAGLIIAANTPIANVAWKVFPALICGNTAILKAAEDTPATAWLFGRIAQEAGLPAGVLNIIQGQGKEAGEPLVAHTGVDIVSFTGSTAVGRHIAAIAGERLAKVSLELGGKNPLVVCDDANLENAVNWTLLAAFSNAGQRCAAASRIIVFSSVYDQFRDTLVERTRLLKVGPDDGDNLGPVINEKQLNNMLTAIETARQAGAQITVGGNRLGDELHREGFYMAPTIIENVHPHDEISVTELFGPILCLYQVRDFSEALCMANDSPYGLTAAIHTRSINRATEFTQKVQAGVAVVNGGTHGSEPHMPFGGLKQSGNGSREPGTEALDVYSELKDIYINSDPGML
ncbi:Aldehyde dehydrogenase [hydrothermal vent metagenome]|uniref:Aldehyde dehydrogenase n=1 Tax=hydrothermal vent metagenome TaxID=652676 RepID=A0A3B0Z086_9ZZZZ